MALLLSRSSLNSSSAAPATPALVGEALHYLTERLAGSEDDPGSAREVIRGVSNHAVRLVIRDPARAREWIGSLPAGEPRLRAEKNMAAAWAQYDPDAVANWVESLPAGERTEVQAFMEEPGR